MASKRGGFRPGAGRKPGSKPPPAEAKRSLSELARELTDEAIETLRSVMRSGQSEAARVAAANAVLDRGYGKPPQFSTGDAKAFKAATEMTDDELASVIASGSSGRAATPTNSAAKPH